MNAHDGRNQHQVPASLAVRQRALAVWPGLDRRRLARTCGDPVRVARLIERRTALPRDAILRILVGPDSPGQAVAALEPLAR